MSIDLPVLTRQETTPKTDSRYHELVCAALTGLCATVGPDLDRKHVAEEAHRIAHFALKEYPDEQDDYEAELA